jgi:hypothetical protein
MKLANTILFTIVTVAILAQPCNTMGMQRVRDLMSMATAKFAQSTYNKPAYMLGACALGAVTAGLGWYLYTALKTAKRTYQIGDEKIIAPEGSQVNFSEHDTTTFTHKKSYFFSLINKNIKTFSPAHAQKKSNVLEMFHNSFEQNPGVRIIIRSDSEINQIPTLKCSNDQIVVTLPGTSKIGRVDYIFMRDVQK